ncbi:MAG: protein translocase subunit SecF, partial [Myxococcales bacterium]|nr:protein translocase subunit SecF [Myxococcales bacterium]
MGWLDFDKDIDFMGYRRYFIGASALLAVLSIVAFFEPGPRFGTDFVGGTEIEVAFKQEVDGGQVRKAIEDAGFASPDVVAVDNEEHPHQFMIRVKEVSSMTDEQKAAITQKLCLVPEEGTDAPPLDEAACPEGIRTSEVKFSPGGDKVAVRYLSEVCGPAQPDVACPPRAEIAAQLSGNVAGVELRPGTNNPIVQNPRDNRVEFYFKSKGGQMMDGLRAGLGADVVPDQPLRVEWIGAKAGSQLRDAAIKSISIAVIVIMLYIAFRFDMRFAPGAILALVHDVFLAMGAMVLARREVTLSTVAALLTIVGYSIN